MTEISRRTFLQRGSIGVAAIAALPVMAHQVLGRPVSDAGVADSGVGAAESLAGPVMVHVADASSGEVRLYLGEHEIVRRDPALVAAILGAARA